MMRVTLLIFLLLALVSASTEAFVVNVPNSLDNTRSRRLLSPQLATKTNRLLSSKPTSSTTTTTAATTTTTQRNMILDDISAFYMAKPLESAMLTFGVKASVADWIAQLRASWCSGQQQQQQQTATTTCMRRNIAYSIYGGLFIGIMCHIEYDHLFPAWFGTEQTVQAVIQKVLFDDFVTAPLFWLPPAYLIQAALFQDTWQTAVGRYWNDIKQQDLLVKYWSIWIPTQTINFSIVPEHLRVAFMASVGFFWFILFSSLSNNGGEEEETAASMESASSSSS